MKKRIALVLVLVISVCAVFGGCNQNKNEKADMTVNLEYTPTSTDYEIAHIEAKENISVDFIVPQDGYIKLMVCDATDYEVYSDDHAVSYVTFFDENGKKLTKETVCVGGYTDKFRFDAGRVTAKIRFENYTKEMDIVSVCWAFAPDTDQPMPVGLGNEMPAAARVNKDGKAKFSFYADYDAVYSFFCGEACVPESDCYFYIEDDEGNKVTGDINIHGTEWAWRKVFLPSGQYTISVFDQTVSAVAECKVVMVKEYTDVIMEKENSLSAPVTFGFNAQHSDERTVKFTTDGSDNYLRITADGSGDYYDISQEYTLKITDKKGNKVTFGNEEGDSDIYYGEQRFNLEGIKGEYTVTIQAADSCVISVSVE